MTNIEFEEDKVNSYDYYDNKPSGLIGFVMKLGLAKDEKQAEMVLVGVGIVAIILTISIFISSGNEQPISEVKILPNETVGSEQGR